MAATVSLSRWFSSAGKSPKWRSGSVSASSRRTAPNTGMSSRAIASSIIARWVSDPSRFKMTPAKRTAGSYDRKPRANAAADSPMDLALMTRSTGASKSFATAAVELIPFVPPSYSPMTPSMTAMSAASAVRQKISRAFSSGTSQVSKLCAGWPLAKAW